MYRILSLAFLGVAVALPAVGQTGALVQQCVGFGQAQYKRVDRSVDRIAAGDFPPPTLERFDARVGAQAVAGALTLRGQVSYGNSRPAVETEFVCLLDALDRPLFFYALPILASRASPTPLVRGPATGPSRDRNMAALPPAPAPAPAPGDARGEATSAAADRLAGASAVQAVPLRGLVRDTGNGLVFSPCDGAPLALQDRTPDQELMRVLRELTGEQQGRAMFVEFYGRRREGTPVAVDVLEVRRAAIETAGCRERFEQREWVVFGSEPAWRLDITPRDMMLNVVGVTPLPAPRFPHGGPMLRGRAILYAAIDGAGPRATIEERRCIDSSSGSVFAYRVAVTHEGASFLGCAEHNPAMPAP